jgi:5-methylcytosine-specific restriction endonuclease McrA
MNIYETKKWDELKKKVLNDPECKCFLCGRKRWRRLKRTGELKRDIRIHLHHITYENAGNETIEDVVPLCPSCHTLLHSIFRRKDAEGFIHELKVVASKYLPEVSRRNSNASSGR